MLPRILRWVAPFEKNVDFMPDLVATVFVAVVRQFARGFLPADAPSLLPWLRSIAHNTAKKWVRGEALRRSLILPLPDGDMPSPDLLSEEVSAPSADLRRLIKRLPRRWRITVRLRIRPHPWSYARIASLFGVTESAARTWYHRAVKRMRGMIVEGEGE
ncbi:MAG: sigma-70 family RNA polymerase sigma factor [Planctomycetes bacterium]|nr:sigma-70 family RNA polymerase sigma factor [Planctomycetota bacterium]